MDPDVSLSSDDGNHAEPQNFVDMLARARDALRDERRRRRRLEIELRTVQNSKGAAIGSPAPMHWKQKIVDLALENFVAMEMIVDQQRRIAELESRLSEAMSAAPRVGMDIPSRASTVRKHQPKTQYAQMTSSVGGSRSAQLSTKKAHPSSPPRPTTTVPSPTRVKKPRVAATTPPRLSPSRRQRPSSATATPVRGVGIVSKAVASSSKKHGGPESAVVGSACATPRSAHSAPSPRGHLSPYNEAMINRLRRSIAPRPTVEQVGVVAHAMVLEAVKFFARRGVNLPVTRLAPCQYRIGSKRINVGVDSGTLVVKAGGGHVDFLDYIERNRLTASNGNSP